MKKINLIIAAVLATGMVSCADKLDVTNPNNQTTYDFGNSESDLQEALIACYNRIRLEGTFARVGYTMDAVRGDEVWNSSQQWYINYDNLNSNGQTDIGDQWIWRDNYHVVNRCNFVLSKVGSASMSDKARNEIKGQADAEATAIYADAYSKDEEFFEFWRLMESYKETVPAFNKILSTGIEYFKYLGDKKP